MRTSLIFSVWLILGSWLSGCAVITGGTSYFARIQVQSNPEAEIEYQGRIVGKGSAIVQVRRSNANSFSFNVKEDGCQPVPFQFYGRSFRSWAMVGSYLTFGIIGLLVDGLAGACWEPDVNNPNIQKSGTRRFMYLVSLPECQAEKQFDKNASFLDVITLFNGRILKGRIEKSSDANFLKIRTADQILQTIPAEEVLEISQEK